MSANELQPGEQVETRFAGCLTQHTIKERKVLGKRVLLRVFPPVPKTTGDWIGADHFRPAGVRRMSRKAKAWLAAAAGTFVLLWYFGVPQFVYGLALLEIYCPQTAKNSLPKSCH